VTVREIVNVLVDGRAQPDIVPDMIRVEVCEDVDGADVFRLQLQLLPERDGTWRHLADERFDLWSRIGVQAGYETEPITLIDGYVTHREVRLAAGGDETVLELTGMDATALMDLEEKTAAWPDRTDTEIARSIFESYGLSYEVQETGVPSDERIATTMQRESDIRFLRRLAARNGFECYVTRGKGYFRSPATNRPAQKALTFGFGPETNVTELRFRLDGTIPSRVEARRVDPFEKVTEDEALGQGLRRRLGARALGEVQPSGHRSVRLLRNEVFGTTSQAQARLRGAREPAERFVTATGTVDARIYGAVLQAKRLVIIRGAGSSLSGLYYVTRVHHVFTVDGYTQEFESIRNGTGLTGEESFEVAALPFAVAPGSAEASRDSGNRVLPAVQTGAVVPGTF
jgi:phage protein D